MRIGTASFLLLLCSAAALAQSAQRGQFEVRGIGGYATFIDESFQHHFFVGGSGHYYVTRRFSVGPEVLYLYRHQFDQDVAATAHFAWDFRGTARVQPYVAGHAGVLRHGAQRFAVNTWTWGVGLGVKISLTDRLFLAPDFRMGIEPIARATIGLGYILSR
jgi:hypothetical protein